MRRYFGLKVKLLTIALLLFCGAFAVNLFAAEKYYWENPKVITSGDARFPVAVNTDSVSYVFWQEVDSQNNRIWISCRIYTDNSTYTENLRFAGPFQYSGEVPDIFSVTAGSSGSAGNNSNSILLTVLSDKKKTRNRKISGLKWRIGGSNP